MRIFGTAVLSFHGKFFFCYIVVFVLCNKDNRNLFSVILRIYGFYSKRLCNISISVILCLYILQKILFCHIGCIIRIFSLFKCDLRSFIILGALHVYYTSSHTKADDH